MTTTKEQQMIDTKKIRACWKAPTMDGAHGVIADLCDDLDAERAKVADLERQVAALIVALRATWLTHPMKKAEANLWEAVHWPRNNEGERTGASITVDDVESCLDGGRSFAARFVDVDSEEMRDLLQDAAHEGRTGTVGVHRIAELMIAAFKARRSAQ